MKTAIAIRHVTFEDVGLLGDALAQAGFGLRYVEAGVERLEAKDLHGADLLVVLGAPIGVYEDDIYPFLKDEIAAVEWRLTNRRPTLGICLGAQIMARALGKRVYPSGGKELGWAAVDLTEPGRTSVLAPLAGVPVLHWHGDTFDLPDGAVHLARTTLAENQAFALGDFALGLQFHLEAKGDQIERWLIGHAGEIAATPGVDVPGLREQTARCAPALAKLVPAIFARWLSGIDSSR